MSQNEEGNKFVDKFYVDNYMNTHDNEDELETDKVVLDNVMNLATMPLQEWVSNNVNFNSMYRLAVPATQNVLGISWNPNTDNMNIVAGEKLIHENSWRYTKRKVLSLVSIIYVTSPLHGSQLHWVHDPQPRQTPSVPPRHSQSSSMNSAVPRNNNSVSHSPKTVPRINPTVPRNIYPPPRKESSAISIAPSSDVRVRIESSTWENSSRKVCPPVPRNNPNNDSPTVPPPQKRKRNRVNRRARRAREREERARIEGAFIHNEQRTFQSPGAPFQFHHSRPTDHDRPTTQWAYISHAARGVLACHRAR